MYRWDLVQLFLTNLKKEGVFLDDLENIRYYKRLNENKLLVIVIVKSNREIHMTISYI